MCFLNELLMSLRRSESSLIEARHRRFYFYGTRLVINTVLKHFISLFFLFFNDISFLWQRENVTVKDRKREKVENIL